MERRKAIRERILVLALALASSLSFSGLTAAPALPGPDADSYLLVGGERIPLVVAEELVALQFEPAEEPVEARRRAEGDAEQLGLEVIESQIGQYQLIVRGTQDAVRRSLASRSDIGNRIAKVRPVFYYRGVRHPDYMMTIPERLVLAFNEDVGLDERSELFQKYGLTNPRKIMGNVYSLDTDEENVRIPGLALRILEENASLMRYAEPAFHGKITLHASTALPAGERVADPANNRGRDPLIDLQWHLWNSGRNTIGPNYGRADNDVDAPRAWNPNTRGTSFGDGRQYGYFGYTGTRPITVAVFDTGTDLQHPEWGRNTNDPFQSPDPSNTVLSPLGFDYFEGDANPQAGTQPTDAHGTSVAGIIGAARNNGRGVSGIAPESRIVTQRIGSAFGFASFDAIAQGVVDSANANVDLANHSWGTTGNVNVLEDAFEYAFYGGRLNRGMAHFVSSANAFTYMTWPALYDWTFSVGGVSDNGQKVSYASWGGKLDFVGSTQEIGRAGILTTDISGSGGTNQANPNNALNPNGDYTFDFNGTSAACPVVVGVAALILAENPNIRIPPDFQGSETLFELMVRTADRPGNPLNYLPFNNSSGRMEYIDVDEEGGEFLNVNQNTTNSMAFRQDQGYRVDGFNFFFGYGLPNPWNALTQQIAPSTFRDYIKVSTPFDVLTTQGIKADFGELVLVYESDFFDDIQVHIDQCLEELFAEEDEEGNVTIPALEDLTDEQIEELLACLPTVDGPWQFQKSPSFPSPNETFYYNTAGDGSYIIEHRGTFPSGEPVGHPFPLVIHSNMPAVGEGADDPAYNPRGRYLRNSTYRVSRGIPLGEYANQGLPVFVDITMKYELGIQDASAQVNALFSQRDTITVLANGSTLATLTGDSNNVPTPPLFPAPDEQPEDEPGDDGEQDKLWPFVYLYENFKSPPEFRTFRFYAGVISGANLDLEVRMQTGSSYLPDYDFSQDELDEDDQIVDLAKRDHRGFQIANVKVWVGDPDPDPTTFLTAQQINSPVAVKHADLGTRPIWTLAQNEVLFIDVDETFVESQVKVVLADAFTRRPVPGNRTQIESTRRQPITLFKTCLETLTQPGQCTPVPILNLVSDPKSALLMYVADSSPNEPRIYMVTDDGFDERSVIPFDPQTMSAPLDRNAQEAIFVHNTESILFTDRNTIWFVPIDTTDLEFVIDTASVKLNTGKPDIEDFRDLVLDPQSDSMIIFSAFDRDKGDYDLYFTLRGINAPGYAATYFPLVDWDGSQEVQCVMSPNGQRLAFVSNSIDMGQGAPPPAGAPYRIWLLDNVQETILFPGTAPIFTLVDLPRDIRLERVGQESYVNALYPTFRPDGAAITFSGYTAAITSGRGEIASVPVPARSTSPISTPFPYDPGPGRTPFPPPDPEPVEQLIQQSQYTFQTGNDGWQFRTATEVGLAAPLPSSSGGRLSLQASNNNTNTYGYFVSPQHALQLFDNSRVLTQTGQPLSERQGPLYLLRYYIRRTTTDVDKAPTLRVRVNSFNFEDYHTLVINSVGSNSMVPGTTTTAVDMLFQPNPHIYALPRIDQNYYMSFDLLNIYPDDDPNGGYILERLDIFRVPLDVVEEIGGVRGYEFISDFERSHWTNYSFPETFTAPTFSFGPSRLEMSTDDPENTFGQWQNLPGTLQFNTTGLSGKVFVRLTARAGSEEPNPRKVPEMRFRIARDDWSYTADQGVVGIGSGTLIPSAGNNRTYRTYLEVPEGLSGLFGLHASWDLLSFETFPDDGLRTSPAKIFLDSLTIDLIRIQGYPEIDPAP